MPGRFQSTVAPSLSLLVLTDTTTGQSWAIPLQGRQGWTFLGAPGVTDTPLPAGARKD